jgi:hypothetical protein
MQLNETKGNLGRGGATFSWGGSTEPPGLGKIAYICLYILYYEPPKNLLLHPPKRRREHRRRRMKLEKMHDAGTKN